MRFRIDLDNLQIPYGTTNIAVLTSHFAARYDATRTGIATRAAGMTMDLFHAMSGSLAAKSVSPHDTGKSSPFRGSGDVDGGNAMEDIDRQDLADGKPIAGDAEFANEPFWFAVGFGDGLKPGCGSPPLGLAIQLCDVTAFRTRGPMARDIEIPQLNGFVTVAFGGSNLQDVARTGLNDRYGNGSPLFIENLSHADLAAKNSYRHRYSPYCHVASRDLRPRVPVAVTRETSTSYRIPVANAQV